MGGCPNVIISKQMDYAYFAIEFLWYREKFYVILKFLFLRKWPHDFLSRVILDRFHVQKKSKMVIEPSIFIISDLKHNKGETGSWVGHSVSGIFYIISSVKK